MVHIVWLTTECQPLIDSSINSNVYNLVEQWSDLVVVVMVVNVVVVVVAVVVFILCRLILHFRRQSYWPLDKQCNERFVLRQFLLSKCLSKAVLTISKMASWNMAEKIDVKQYAVDDGHNLWAHERERVSNISFELKPNVIHNIQLRHIDINVEKLVNFVSSSTKLDIVYTKSIWAKTTMLHQHQAIK